jgi:protein-disulfide isomerase
MSKQQKKNIAHADHILGTKTATLELLEYGDFQCSSCGDSYLVVRKILRELKDSLVFVYRNFPLTEIHPDAFNAALAAEAAALQNKFWEMYNILFQHQANLGVEALFYYARQIGLDMNRFEQDIQSEALASKVNADVELGLQSGVSGTPSFYINGEQFDQDGSGNGLIGYLEELL